MIEIEIEDLSFGSAMHWLYIYDHDINDPDSISHILEQLYAQMWGWA